MAEEVTALDLPVTGRLPVELTGLYVRNGSNPRAGSGHWFLGDGMVHGVRLEEGRAAWYRNRWVRTPQLAGDGGPPGAERSPANTSLVLHGGELLALCEVGWPYRLSPEDLSTVGATPLGGLGSSLTAHPKRDPATGALHAFGYGFVPPFLTSYVIAPTGGVERAEELPLGGATMLHDFAVTDRDAVFWDLPVRFDLDIAVAGGMPFVWAPETGARVGVLPLGGAAGDLRWVDVPPCFVFHGTNAWREGDEVVLDVSRLPSAFAPTDGTAGPQASGRGSLRRWRVDPVRGTFREDVVVDRALDLPTIAPAEVGRPHGRAWYVEAVDEAGVPRFGPLVGLDPATAALDVWDPGPAVMTGEPLYVDAGSGWVLCYVHDRSVERSELVVLAADDLAAGPVARVALPRRVPSGFHGTWVPA